MAGFVYVMTNPAFPHLVKIGKSAKDPRQDRVNELNHTGVPSPFRVEYFALVEDEGFVERSLHSHFDENRPNKEREFFQIGVAEAIIAVRDTANFRGGIKYEEVFYVAPKEIEERRRQKEEAQRREENAAAERRAADERRRRDEERRAAEEARRIEIIQEQEEYARQAQMAAHHRKRAPIRWTKRIFWIVIGTPIVLWISAVALKDGGIGGLLVSCFFIAGLILVIRDPD